MANGWGNNGNSGWLFFWGSKITTDGDCSHEIKRHLLLGMKAMTNLDSILKSRDITLPTKVHLVKAMVFPLVMYGCKSWTVKKAERQKIDAFELWCWRRLLRVPWTAGRSNQSILKELSPGCSLEGLMLKLRLQYFGHMTWRADSFEKTLMLGKIEGGKRRGYRRWDDWMPSPTRWTWVWINCGSWWWTGRPGVLQSMVSERVRHDWATELPCRPVVSAPGEELRCRVAQSNKESRAREWWLLCTECLVCASEHHAQCFSWVVSYFHPLHLFKKPFRFRKCTWPAQGHTANE